MNDGPATANLKSSVPRRSRAAGDGLTLCLAIVCLAACCRAADGPAPEKPKQAEIRILEQDNRVLLSRDGAPLAVAQLRPVAGAKPVLTAAAAKEALRGPGALLAASGNEQIREMQFAVPKGDAEDRLGIILRVKPAAAGARLLVSSALSGPSRDDLAPGGRLPAPEPLELAIQLFPDAAGSLPDATFVDNARQPMPMAPLEKKGDAKSAQPSPPEQKEQKPGATPPRNAVSARRARLWTFETKKDYRVTIARSAPADWSVQRLTDAVLLTARLLPDAREPSEFGPFVVYVGAGADDARPELSPLKLDKKETPARDFIEGAVRVYASGANPCVLAETAVIAEIACPPKPNGDVPIERLPCFFWEAPSSASAEGEFRFRFAPPAEGSYGVRIAVVAPTGQVRADATAFRAGPPQSAGFVKVRPGERQFRLDDGSVFVPAGAALLTAEKNTAEEFRRQFSELARRGGNAACLSVTAAGLALEGPEAGRFDPDVACALDDILRAAQARDIRVIVVAEDGLNISRDSASHPYFREKGGPLSATPEFFRNVAAKKLFQVRLNYLAARYSAYRSVLSWSLMDAVDESWPALKDNPDDLKLKPGDADLARRARRDVQDWANEMALHIKGMDGHEHPVCVSANPALRNPWADLERVEQLDWTLIGQKFPSAESAANGESGRDETALLRAWAVAARQPGRAHKPFLIGGMTLDPAAQVSPGAGNTFAHNCLFASLAGGLAGAPMMQWDFTKAAHTETFTAASVFASALATAAEAEANDELRVFDESIEALDKTPVRVLGRVGQRGMAVWIHDKRSVWSAKDEPGEIKGVEVRLPGLIEGSYTLVWLDTWTGRVVSADIHKAPAKHVDKPLEPTVLRAPPFKRDIALLLTRTAKDER